MDVLDYIERESADTLREMMKDYAAGFDRAAKVATALVGGAAALVAYAPGAAGGTGMRWVLLGVAAAWALAVCWLVLRGALSNTLESGASVRAMQQRYLDEGGQLVPYDGSTQPAMTQLRLAELNRRHNAALAYSRVLSRRAKALNAALVVAALAPLVGALLALGLLAL